MTPATKHVTGPVVAFAHSTYSTKERHHENF
jgi:hypothetical protein